MHLRDEGQIRPLTRGGQHLTIEEAASSNRVAPGIELMPFHAKRRKVGIQSTTMLRRYGCPKKKRNKKLLFKLPRNDRKSFISLLEAIIIDVELRIKRVGYIYKGKGLFNINAYCYYKRVLFK